MGLNLEGSNSAETSSPFGGGIGLHLLSIWIAGCGLVDRLFFVWLDQISFIFGGIF